MLNKLLCWMWGHVWIKELEGFTHNFPIQVSPGKWIMKDRFANRMITKCKHCGARYE